MRTRSTICKIGALVITTCLSSLALANTCHVQAGNNTTWMKIQDVCPSQVNLAPQSTTVVKCVGSSHDVCSFSKTLLVAHYDNPNVCSKATWEQNGSDIRNCALVDIDIVKKEVGYTPFYIFSDVGENANTINLFSVHGGQSFIFKNLGPVPVTLRGL